MIISVKPTLKSDRKLKHVETIVVARECFPFKEIFEYTPVNDD